EGHHLPAVAIDAFASATRLEGPKVWLDSLIKLPMRTARQIRVGPHAAPLRDVHDALAEPVADLKQRLDDVRRALEGMHPGAKLTRKQRKALPMFRLKEQDTWRFPMGVVPDSLLSLFREAHGAAAATAGVTAKLARVVAEAMKEDEQSQALATAHSTAAWTLTRLTDMTETFAGLIRDPAPESRPPVARWIEYQCEPGKAKTDFRCCVSPTSAADNLRAMLWEQCDGAVVTSATL